MRKQIQNQSGQGTLEMVLIMAVIVSATIFISNILEENQYAQKLFGQPWGTLSGMIECGTWTGCGQGKHPNSPSRILSLKPDE